MPIFKKLASAAKAATTPFSPPDVQPVEVDPYAGDPVARRFASELAQGHWEEFHDFLEATRDWTDRDFYVFTLSEVDGRPDWLDQWVAAKPASSIPLLFRGDHAIKWGWQARSGKRAKLVAEGAWEVFFQRLTAAERDLEQAQSLDASDPTPYSRAMWSAIGLELGVQEITRRFDEVVRRDPLHVGAHESMLQALAPKWYGSNDKVLAFARDAASRAPEGHGLHALIAYAHLERWLDLYHSDDEKAQQKVYFRDPDVGSEVLRAADNSIRSPRLQVTRWTVQHRNAFAMCFRLMQDWKAQLEQMELIGSAVTKLPWAYQGDAGTWYAKHRAMAESRLAAGG